MKPEQFICEFGYTEAKRIVDEAPESGQPLYYNTVNGVYLFTGYRNTYFVNGVWGTEDDHSEMLGQDFKCLSLTHLKRLVESLEILDKSGGYEPVKAAISNYRASGDMVTFSSLEMRLKDHESIYGEQND